MRMVRVTSTVSRFCTLIALVLRCVDAAGAERISTADVPFVSLVCVPGVVAVEVRST
jgi:hypothetical protein